MIFHLKVRPQYNVLSEHLKGSYFAWVVVSTHTFQMQGCAYIKKHKLYQFQFKLHT